MHMKMHVRMSKIFMTSLHGEFFYPTHLHCSETIAYVLNRKILKKTEWLSSLSFSKQTADFWSLFVIT